MGDGVFVFEDSQVVWSALHDYEESKPVRGKALEFFDLARADEDDIDDDAEEAAEEAS